MCGASGLGVCPPLRTEPSCRTRRRRHKQGHLSITGSRFVANVATSGTGADVFNLLGGVGCRPIDETDPAYGYFYSQDSGGGTGGTVGPDGTGGAGGPATLPQDAAALAALGCAEIDCYACDRCDGGGGARARVASRPGGDSLARVGQRGRGLS